MGGVPNDIPGVGSVKLTPQANPVFDPTADGGLSSEEYYVYSRVDGATSLYDVIVSTGLGTDKTIAILTKLRKLGALVMPGDERRRPSSKRIPLRPRVTAPADTGKAPAAARATDVADAGAGASPGAGAAGPTETDVAPLELTAGERDAMAETVDLSERERRRVIMYMRKVADGDFFALLAVSVDVDKKSLKRAYFRLSKEFHPDRHYGKSMGSFGPWLAKIFETASKAFDVLVDTNERARHLAGLKGEVTTSVETKSQTPAEHAKQLFEHACASEVQGELEQALNYFGASIRVDPRARYLRRAAEAAILAKQFEIAEKYAIQAAESKSDDPSYARVLANVYFAAGNFEAAEDAVVSAMLLKTENDVLAAELEQDLDKIRRALVGV